MSKCLVAVVIFHVHEVGDIKHLCELEFVDNVIGDEWELFELGVLVDPE
jgi:hypothetical protein